MAIAATRGHSQLAQPDTDIDAAERAAAQIEAADIREPSRDITDAETLVQVQAALSRGMRAGNVRSEVKNGVATLRGSVTSDDEKRQAERLAREVEGVSRVRNELVVERAAPASDRVEAQNLESTPAEAIEARLRSDARLASRDIDVHTKADVVTLTGEVATNDEREAAGKIAAEAAEGIEVRNRLEVATAPLNDLR